MNTREKEDSEAEAVMREGVGHYIDASEELIVFPDRALTGGPGQPPVQEPPEDNVRPGQLGESSATDPAHSPSGGWRQDLQPGAQ